MRHFIALFFPFLVPSPKIGEKYVSASLAGNPWNDMVYEVVDIKNNWVKIRYGINCYRCEYMTDFKLFFVKA